MSGDDFESQLGAYIDGELAAGPAAALTAHLRECPACARAHERQLAVRAALQAALPPLRAPQQLRAGIRQSLRATARTAAVRSRPDGRWLALAAVLVSIIISSTWSLAGRRAADQFLTSEVLASHVRSLIGTHLTDVASSDQHTVKPWFNGKLDYSPTVSDFAGRGYPLIGGRLDYLAGRAVAALVYGRRQHVINVFLWPTGEGRSRGPQAVTRQGYHMRGWTTSDYEYWVVSDLGEAELGEFTQLLSEAHSATGVSGAQPDSVTPRLSR
jgi:anti-sigma factor RsiW